jgi:hypothetical protein
VTQREDPHGKLVMGMFKAEMAMRQGPGAAKCSGAQLLDFERGWGALPFHFGPVHFLRVLSFEGAVTALLAECGTRFPPPMVKGQGMVVFAQGDFKRCVKCQRKIDRKPHAGT